MYIDEETNKENKDDVNIKKFEKLNSPTNSIAVSVECISSSSFFVYIK